MCGLTNDARKDLVDEQSLPTHCFFRSCLVWWSFLGAISCLLWVLLLPKSWFLWSLKFMQKKDMINGYWGLARRSLHEHNIVCQKGTIFLGFFSEPFPKLQFKQLQWCTMYKSNRVQIFINALFSEQSLDFKFRTLKVSQKNDHQPTFQSGQVVIAWAWGWWPNDGSPDAWLSLLKTTSSQRYIVTILGNYLRLHLRWRGELTKCILAKEGFLKIWKILVILKVKSVHTPVTVRTYSDDVLLETWLSGTKRCHMAPTRPSFSLPY